MSRTCHERTHCATADSNRTRFRRALRVSSPTIARPCAVNARPSGLPSRSPSCHASRSAAVRPPPREIIEPRNRGGLVTKQIKVTIRTYFEVAEVGAGFGKHLIGKPLTGAAFIGTIGLDWQFAGIAPIHAAGADRKSVV